MKMNSKARVSILALVFVIILINTVLFQPMVSALSMIYMDSNSLDWIANLNDSSNVYAGGWRNNSSNGGSSTVGKYDSNGKSIRVTTPSNGTGRVNYFLSGLPDTNTVTYTNLRSVEIVFRLNAGTVAGAKLQGLGYRFEWDMSTSKWKIVMNGLSDNRAAGGVNWAAKVAGLISPGVVHTLRFVQKDISDTERIITNMYIDGVRVTAATDGTIFPEGGQPASLKFMQPYSSNTTYVGWNYIGTNPSGTSDLIFDLYSFSYYGMVIPMNITSTTPMDNAYAFPRNGTIAIAFDSDIDINTLTTSNVSIALVSNPSQQLSYTRGAYDSSTRTYSIDLTNTPLAYKSDYVLTVNTSVVSTDGKTLIAPYIVKFSTMVNYTYKSSSSSDSIENAPIGNLINGAYNGGWRNLTTNTSTFSAITYGTFDDDGMACRITTKPGDVGQLYYFMTGLPQPPIVAYTPVRYVEWQFKIGEGYYDGVNTSSNIVCGGFKFLWDNSTNTWLLKFNALSNATWQGRVMAQITPNVKYSLKMIQRDDSATAWTILGIYLNGTKLTSASDGTKFPEAGLSTGFNVMGTGSSGTWAYNKCNNPATSTQDLVYDIYTLQYYGLNPMYVTATTPSSGQSGVALNGTVAITFDKDINPATLTTDNISIAPRNNPSQKLSYTGGTSDCVKTQGKNQYKCLKY